MTPAEFRAALSEHRLTQREFARQSGVAISTVNRWAMGIQPIPGWVDWVSDLLTDLNTMHEQLDIRP